jgi:hypothetical protein
VSDIECPPSGIAWPVAQRDPLLIAGSVRVRASAFGREYVALFGALSSVSAFAGGSALVLCGSRRIVEGAKLVE